ncbi:phage major capsid protein [Rathayibacter sp. AY1C5]|uniref:phage major capsid protein n=1 Tax=Rathayibacter sp. AY1C5 TaxID=2080538 RepID=UPI000CE76BB5|nr:phage major capsid protein [Rathayibacter sp. AY1C5]PPG61622.1 phage major capsid protein [Rathayibacter sp. AY1C5]
MNPEAKLKTLHAEWTTLAGKSELTDADATRVLALRTEIETTERIIATRKQAEAGLAAFGASASVTADGASGLLPSRADKAAGFVQAYRKRLTETGYAAKGVVPSGTVQVQYDGPVVNDPRAVFSLAGLVRNTPTDVPSGAYLRQTIRDLQAAPVELGAPKPQSALAIEHKTWELATLAHLLEPVSKQWLADIDGLTPFIAAELAYGLDEATNDYLLNGGVSENGTTKSGLLNTPAIVTQPYSTSKLLTIRAALGALDTAGVNATGIALAPSDWEAIETATDTTGRTLIAADGTSAERRLWGVPVTLVNGMPAGTGLVGDWSTVTLFRRGVYEITVVETGTAEIDGATVDLYGRNLARFRGETRIGTAITSTPSFRKLDLTA